MSINNSGKQGKGITLLQRVDKLKALKIKSGEKEADFKEKEDVYFWQIELPGISYKS